jgi:acetyl-CoA C-acetyltransferase
MALDPRTPVCVGAAAITQRVDEPEQGLDAVGLMAAAVRAAAADSGRPGLLADAALLGVAGGSWTYANAPALVAAAAGMPSARTHLIVPGVLQTQLFDRALSAIARGELDTAVVCGGEAKWRELRGRITGRPAPVTPDGASAPPDEVVTPHGHVISPREIACRMFDAASHYALLEQDRRAADAQRVEEHRTVVADFWARVGRAAAANPDAWYPDALPAEAIATTGPKNRIVAFPYNKWHVSQQNVDQSGALVFCSVARATELGIPRDRWVFPHAIVDSNHMVPVSERAVMHRSPGFALAGARAAELAGVALDRIPHVDLYSCFPIAVRTQVLELGLDPEGPLSVTGGMTFGGGPFGNYVVQSTVRMLQVLREHPGEPGLVTAISGMITKQGVSIWSTDPAAAGYRHDDVSAAAAAATAVVPVVDPVDAQGTVLSFTVTADADGPARAIALVDLGDGTRALAVADDRSLAGALVEADAIGAPASVTVDGAFHLD